MILKTLILKNYRNYPDLTISFHSGHNLLIGENGQGKTNILESIYLLTMMKSFRPVLDKDIIRQGEDFYFVKGLFDDKGSETSISIGVYQGKKEVQYNQDKVKKLSSLVGLVKVVIFTHSDIELIVGSPSVRRRYIDMTLSLADRRYFEILQNYHRVLKQRNATLKKVSDGSESRETISIWDRQLIEYGSELIYIRKNFFDPINNITQQLYNCLKFDIQDFYLCYRSSIGSFESSDTIKDQFQKKLRDYRDKEIFYKQSLFGPHKDDFLIRSGKNDFKRFASQGQNRAVALTLKLAMTQYIEEMSQEKAILLLDDVLLDLDVMKKERFIELLFQRQNFLTTTTSYGYEKILSTSKVFYVQSNNLITS